MGRAIWLLSLVVIAVGAAESGIFTVDRDLPWDRFHRLVFVRAFPDGREAGDDELDPPLLGDTRHLLTAPSHQAAVALLDDLLAAPPTIDDPLRRALLQRELWAVFDWSADPLGEHQDERRALQIRLARLIRRLALPAAAIAALPDNYRAAVASGNFAKAFAPQQPEAAFLPPDLQVDDGPWVQLAQLESDEPVAFRHTEFFGGRSDFRLYLSLPGGRVATLDYLKRLNAVPRPWREQPDYAQLGGAPIIPSPDLPELPQGTTMVLVRTLVLIDDAGRLVVSPLVETVQSRTYAKDPAKIAGVFGDRAGFAKSELRRRPLLAGVAGGLVALGPEAATALPFLFAKQQFHDFFETMPPVKPPAVLGTCINCHAANGIHSFQTYIRDFGPRQVLPSRLVDHRQAPRWWGAVSWKQRQFSWGLLAGLMRSSPP